MRSAPAAGPYQKHLTFRPFFLTSILMPLLAPNGAPRTPKGQPKSPKSCKNAPQNPFREGLGTQPGKSHLPHPARDLPICLPYSPCHAFYTSQRVPSGSLWAPFCLHFGSFLGTLGTKSAPRSGKEPFMKSIAKLNRKRCLKVPKWSQKGLQSRPNPDHFWHLFPSPGPFSSRTGPGPHFGSLLYQKLMIFHRLLFDFCWDFRWLCQAKLCTQRALQAEQLPLEDAPSAPLC